MGSKNQAAEQKAPRHRGYQSDPDGDLERKLQ